MNNFLSKGAIAIIALALLSGLAFGQIKYPVTSDAALTVGTVVTVDGTDANKIVAADGPIPTAEVIGIITAIQNVGGTDFYLVKTEGYLEISGATFTPGTRLTSDATGQIVASTSVKDVLVGIAVSGTRVQILINDPKIDDIFDGDITITGDLTVEGDGFFEQNIDVTDTVFAGYIDAGNIYGDSIFSEYNETDVLIVNDSAYFGGPVVFEGGLESDTINVGWLIGTQNDTIYFEQYLAGPEVVIDSIEAFGDGPIVIKDSTEFREKVTFENEIIVEGTSTFNDDVTIDADLDVTGEASFDSSVYIAEGLEVDGDGVFHDNVTVDDTLFAGYIDAGNIYGDSIFSEYNETNDLVVNDSAFFDGPVTFDSTVIFNQPIQFDTLRSADGDPADTIVVDAQLKIHGELIADSIQAVGDVIELDDNIDVHGDADIDDSLSVGGNTYLQGDLVVDGDGVFHDNVTVDDTLFAGYIDAGNIIGDSIFSEYNETDVLIVNDSAYFGGPVVFEGGLDSDTIRTGWLIGTQNDTIYFENYLAGPEVVIDSIEAFGDGPIVIKDSTEFREKVTFENEIIVEGDATFEGEAQFDSIATFGDSVHFGDDITVAGNGIFDNNINVEDTTFTGYLDVENDATIGGDLLVSGEATFDSFATFNDSVYFEGPVVFGDGVEFEQGISQSSRVTYIEFGTAPLQVITSLSFVPQGDVVKLAANLILSDEYSITPNYNGAKITVELYDVTNSAVLKSYTVFLQDKDWYEIKEVSISHVMSTPTVTTNYTVRCYADGWGNGGRVIQGDLTAIAIQH